MKSVIAMVVVVLAVVAGWFVLRQPPPSPTLAGTPPPAQQVSTPEPREPAEPEVKFPIEQVADGAAAPAPAGGPGAAAPAEAVPELEESDGAASAWAEASVGEATVKALLPEHLVRRVVASVDNLSRERVSPRLWPVATAKGLPEVTRSEQGLFLAPVNARRYATYVAMAESADVDALVAGYKRLYPVFQQAYRELGYPTGNFNDRLVAVLDHLIAAPEVEGPIPLVQPKVIYQFADPELEALSAGQKMMVRMGPDNARRIKARLRVIRQRLVGQR
ncbi:MAG: DUF3014 domain-containing protein [Rhodocyclaceae bacterium]|nr:DUF3014 domain-containing protein [Rhodocyclaceae bacterium]